MQKVLIKYYLLTRQRNFWKKENIWCQANNEP